MRERLNIPFVIGFIGGLFGLIALTQLPLEGSRSLLGQTNSESEDGSDPAGTPSGSGALLTFKPPKGAFFHRFQSKGETVTIPASKDALIICSSGDPRHPMVMQRPQDFDVNGLHIYEYTQNFLMERQKDATMQSRWPNKRFGFGGLDTLEILEPAKIYYVFTSEEFEFSCSKRLDPRCGDGFKDTGEDCDTGGICRGGSKDGTFWETFSDADDCRTGGGSPDPLPGDGCSIECRTEVCGDGVVQIKGADRIHETFDDEECDNGSLCSNDVTKTCISNADCNEDLGTCSQVEGTQGDFRCGGDADGRVCSAQDDCLITENTCDYNTEEDENCSSSCKNLLCGNNRLDAGEECDDGNKTDLDECPNNCLIPRCGDKILHVERGEACDDGNSLDSDGCSSNCRFERCGDGIKQPHEECDAGGICQGATLSDGSIFWENSGEAEDCRSNGGRTEALSGDGCSDRCMREFCGDGVVQELGRDGVPETVDDEECDNGSYCSQDDQRRRRCRFVQDCDQSLGACLEIDPPSGEFRCNADPASRSCTKDDHCTVTTNTCNYDDLADVQCTTSCKLSRCGNGTVEGNEQCDDGNEVNNDTCPNNCRLPLCGDGILSPNEECDDRNKVNGDGCSFQCKKEEVAIPLPKAKSGVQSFCGNRIIESGEQCDDGNTSGGDGCASNCQREQIQTVSIPSQPPPQPGGPVQQLPPVVTVQVTPSPTEKASAPPPPTREIAAPSPRCGNGFLDPGEQCDDGNIVNNDGCGSSCQIERADLGREQKDILTPLCGNGTLDESEECDDGNRDPGDGCTETCTQEVDEEKLEDEVEEAEPPPPTLPPTLPPPPIEEPRDPLCGNGIFDGNEECDDGNSVDDDGCSSICTLEELSITRRAAAPKEPDESATDEPTVIAELPEEPPLDLSPPKEDSPPPTAQVIPKEPPPPVPTPVPPQAISVAETGPGSVAIMAIGAGFGFAWVRRKRRKREARTLL